MTDWQEKWKEARERRREPPGSVITEGFPEFWFVQDRPNENTALLCRQVLGMWPGSTCICLRPKMIDTKEWLYIARAIAHAIVEREQRIADEEQTEEDRKHVAYMKTQAL